MPHGETTDMSDEPTGDAVRENGEIKSPEDAIQPEALTGEAEPVSRWLNLGDDVKAKILGKIGEMEEALSRPGKKEEVEAARSFTHPMGEGWSAIVTVKVQIRHG